MLLVPLCFSDPRPKSDNGLLSLGDLGIRRISDISHINEIRREVQGMDHLASEFYEISRLVYILILTTNQVESFLLAP